MSSAADDDAPSSGGGAGRAETPADSWVRVLQSVAPRPLTIAEIARRLAIERYDRRAMQRDLEALVAEGKLKRVGKTRYQWRRDLEVSGTRPGGRSRGPATIVGRYLRTRSGYGFVSSQGQQTPGGDVLVPRGREGEALHGDRVRVEILRRDRQGRSTGRVLEVVERANERVIGTLETRRTGKMGVTWWLVPERDQLPVLEITGGVELLPKYRGKMAMARMIHPPGRMRSAEGRLERVLGDPDLPEVQFLRVALEHEIRLDFPADVEREMGDLPAEPTAEDIAGREDLRELPFVTIDGADAKDFDDAVCALPREEGGERLWVAIADVSHYVRPGTGLDEEAARRGTSVYFPDRAVPMLPEGLSNGLCSLVAGRDRLVMVAEMELDRSGSRVAQRFYRGVIRSRARLTYDQVAQLLETGDAGSVGELDEMLRRMHDLMRRLHERRIAVGALDLDLPEAVVDLDPDGRAAAVRKATRTDAHRIIEELMLEANRAVAQHLFDEDVPLPYRIHEEPEVQDLEDLNRTLHFFGQHVETSGGIHPAEVQKVLSALEGNPAQRVLARRTLRALKQARYHTENVGHFGLAFRFYCHFTSPIRRYPDLLVHRQLGDWIDGAAEEARERFSAIAQASSESSDLERKAMEAERAMLDVKKAEFMKGHLFEPEPGQVVTVAKYGFFVELDAYPVEGLVHMEEMPGRWDYDEDANALVRPRSGDRIQLGDRVVVEAVEASVRRGQVAFALIEQKPSKNKARRPEKKGRRRPRVRDAKP